MFFKKSANNRERVGKLGGKRKFSLYLGEKYNFWKQGEGQIYLILGKYTSLPWHLGRDEDPVFGSGALGPDLSKMLKIPFSKFSR